MLTVVDLLRHGELAGGIKYRGQTDDPLTIKGRADMDAVWAHLRGKVEVIVTSPLGRCREPAQNWAKDAGIPCLIEDRMREMHYGDWEGLTREQIEQRFPGMLAQWRTNPEGMHIPGAESLEAFSDRVLDGIEHIFRTCAGRHVLLVAHSGSLRMLLMHVLGGPMATARRFTMPYAGWSRIQHDGRLPYLEFLNREPN